MHLLEAAYACLVEVSDIKEHCLLVCLLLCSGYDAVEFLWQCMGRSCTGKLGRAAGRCGLQSYNLLRGHISQGAVIPGNALLSVSCLVETSQRAIFCLAPKIPHEKVMDWSPRRC